MHNYKDKKSYHHVQLRTKNLILYIELKNDLKKEEL